MTDPHHPPKDTEDDVDFEMENAIGDAFKQFLSQESREDSGLGLGAEVGEIASEVAINQEDASGPSQSEAQSGHYVANEANEPTDADDIDLEAAIGDAFKAISDGQNIHNNENDQNDQSVQIGSEPGREASAEPADDVYENDDDASLENAIGDAFKSLTDVAYQKEPVLEHDDEEPADNEVDLESIVQNVVDQIGSEVPASQQEELEEEDTSQPKVSFERSQMHQILQNAFNMAMQNPQQLLESVDNEEAQEDSEPLVSTVTASVQDALENGEPEAKRKALSIAETLALHRSSMDTGPKRDYASIQSLEDTKKLGTSQHLTPQLTNILLSLSQRIQSGSDPQNLMLVIRQMTNALMLNKGSLAKVSTIVQDTVKAMKSLETERSSYVRVLAVTKQYLARQDDETLRNAHLLVDNVCQFLLNKEIDVSDVDADGQVDLLLNAHLTGFLETSVAVINTFVASRKFESVVKPELDAIKHKEKIRNDNKERKRKWREENAERNKDNDLRARVSKRANAMFGDESSPEKNAWIEEEYKTRRERRLAKRRSEDQSSKLSESEQNLNNSGALSEHMLTEQISRVFHLVAETGSGSGDDSATLLHASATAVAVVTSISVMSLGITDFIGPQALLKLLLTSVLTLAERSGNYMKIPFFLKSTNMETGVLAEKIALLTGTNARPQLSALERLRENQKLNEFRPAKQPRMDLPKVTSTLEAGNGLRMPQFKPPSTERSSALSQKPVFISNKVAMGESVGASSLGGLRKPGTFQVPDRLRNRTFG